MKEQLYHRCQIDDGSYCNSFIDIIMVQVNYNLYIMQEEEELGEDDDEVYSINPDTHPPLTPPPLI